MMSEFSPFEPEVEKEGILSKLGGGAGGSKNWRDRYFVLTDHLYYYDSKQEYSQNPQNPLGRVNLLSYYVAKSDDASFEFCVHAYPKSLTCRASSKAELDDWIAAIMAPLERLKSPNAAEGSGKKKKKKQKKASGGGGGARSEEEDQ